MPRGFKLCALCPEVIDLGSTYCPAHAAEQDAARRPTGNPYKSKGHRLFREAVLARHPICVECRARPSTVADHHPIERRDLEAQGLDPNDPAHGRGLCKPCHDRHTAATSPAGWASKGRDPRP